MTDSINSFLPPVLQPELKDSKLSFMVNPARKTVFEGRHFVATRAEDVSINFINNKISVINPTKKVHHGSRDHYSRRRESIQDKK